MRHPALRVPRVGFALVLLPVFLGSASGAPAPGIAAPSMQPALKQAASAPLSADRPVFVTATISCISGSCQVQVYAPAAAAPTRPLPQTTPAPQALAQR
jgi:hypothetical protein